MTREVEMSESETPVRDAAKIMGEKRIGSLIVTRNRQPYGIFTERDLLTSFLAKEKSLDTMIGEAASSPLITIPSGTSVHKAADTMASKHVRRLPITKNNKIIGIVTARDLVEAYSK